MNASIKRELGLLGAVLSALLGLAVLLAVMAMSGCSKPTSDQCAQWQAALAAYDATIGSGRIPSQDETAVANTIRALYAVQCAGTATLTPVPSGTKEIGTLPLPRQPKRIVTTDTGARVIYYLHTPFSILQDPTGVFRKDGSLATITIGPLYRTSDKVRSQYLWMPDQAWLQRVRSGEPTMLPIR